VASAFLESVLRTNIYVDGFNLYYGALRKTPHRWVNLEALFQFLLPKNTIHEIKYFTALVSARPNDPSQPQRQQLYLRALATLPKVSVHLGHFLVHEVTMPLVVAPGQPQQYARVIKTEEKGSDVNLATQLLHDAHMNRFDVAVVVSNDSDLLGPIKIVRNELGKKSRCPESPAEPQQGDLAAHRLHKTNSFGGLERIAVSRHHARCHRELHKARKLVGI